MHMQFFIVVQIYHLGCLSIRMDLKNVVLYQEQMQTICERSILKEEFGTRIYVVSFLVNSVEWVVAP